MNTDSIKEYVLAIDDINKVSELTISRFSIDGLIANIDYNDLLKFSNLNKITLINVNIDYNDFSIIRRISNLKNIELINCEIEDNVTDLINDLKLEDLILDNTVIDLERLTNGLLSLTVRNILYKFPNIACNTLDLSRTNIEVTKKSIIVAKSIIISHSGYYMYKDFFDKANVHIVVKNDYRDIIEDEL